MQKARNKGFELEQSFEESFEESCEEGRKLCGSLKKEENSVKKDAIGCLVSITDSSYHHWKDFSS
ncbi:unnamed protein product [Camellia sinensis]